MIIRVNFDNMLNKNKKTICWWHSQNVLYNVLFGFLNVLLSGNLETQTDFGFASLAKVLYNTSEGVIWDVSCSKTIQKSHTLAASDLKNRNCSPRLGPQDQIIPHNNDKTILGFGLDDHLLRRRLVFCQEPLSPVQVRAHFSSCLSHIIWLQFGVWTFRVSRCEQLPIWYYWASCHGLLQVCRWFR